MTEEEWLASDNPQAMLGFAEGGTHYTGKGPGHCHWSTSPAFPRKLRLFACACARQVWHLLTDERSRRAVEVAERYADGDRSEDIYDAWNAAADAWEVEQKWVRGLAASCTMNVIAGPQLIQRAKRSGVLIETQAALLRCLCGNPFQPLPVARTDDGDCYSLLGPVEPFPEDWYGSRRAAVIGQHVYERCPWTTWQGGLIISTTRRMYDSRDFSDAPILADMLEEAGCNVPELLAHLRRPEPHARGCHVLDLLLGFS